MTEATEKIRERVLALIDSEFESDASFERELGLSEKTVSNWRRGRSASFMRHLPELSELFGVNVGELLDLPLSAEGDQLSEEEIALLTLYRKSHILPKKMRRALTETLESTINMYIAAGESRKKK
jgi:transcriptional regulator with XRE-family HTH domain